MTDIFLSYTERDRDTARRVAEALGSAGWSVWWDRRIPAGETWRNVLEHALEDTRCMVVLWSAKSIKSEWVYEEATEGRRMGKLVPVMIEAVRPPAGFREIQAADLTGWDGSPDFDGLSMLLSDLENLLGKPGENAADRTTSASLHSAGLADATHNPDPPYNSSDLPRRATPGAIVRWPLGTLAGGALLAGAVAFIGLPSRQQSAPSTPESASRQPEPSVPPAAPAAAPAAPSPPAAAVQTEISRDSRAALAPLATPQSSRRTQPEPSTAIKRSDSRLLSAGCADLLARIQLGETLSEASQSRFNKEC